MSLVFVHIILVFQIMWISFSYLGIEVFQMGYECLRSPSFPNLPYVAKWLFKQIQPLMLGIRIGNYTQSCSRYNVFWTSCTRLEIMLIHQILLIPENNVVLDTVHVKYNNLHNSQWYFIQIVNRSSYLNLCIPLPLLAIISLFPFSSIKKPHLYCCKKVELIQVVQTTQVLCQVWKWWLVMTDGRQGIQT